MVHLGSDIPKEIGDVSADFHGLFRELVRYVRERTVRRGREAPI